MFVPSILRCSKLPLAKHSIPKAKKDIDLMNFQTAAFLWLLLNSNTRPTDRPATIILSPPCSCPSMPRKDQDSTPKWPRWDLEQNSPNHPLTSDQGGGTFRYKTFLINFIFLCIFSPFFSAIHTVESGHTKKLKKNAWRQLLRVKLRTNSQVRQRLCCSE